MRPAADPGVSGSLVRRLRWAFGLGLALLVLVGSLSAAALGVAGGRLERQASGVTAAVEANSAALQAMLDAESAFRGHELTGEPGLLRAGESALSQVPGLLDEVAGLVGDPSTRDLVERQQAAARSWVATRTDPDAGAGTGSPRAATGFDELRALNGAVAQALVADRAGSADGTRRLLTTASLLVGVLTALSAVAGAVTAMRTVRALHLPLRRLGDVLERLRMGETTARADPSGHAEFAVVARAANALADESERLRDLQREQARLRRAAHDASRRVREELGRDAVLRAAAQALGTALSVDRVWVRMSPPTDPTEAGSPGPRDVQWARAGLDELPDLAAVAGTDLPLARRLWRDGDVLVVPNVRRIAASRDAMTGRGLALELGAAALLAAPVGGNDDVLAVAVLACTGGPRDFTTDEVAAVQTICGDLGRALEHSLLFERQRELVDRLQELDRQKTDFLSTVSHELRTPLTSIAGYAELLRDGDAGPVTAPMARMLEVIERNTARLKALIEDLLTLSRIESAAFRTSVGDVGLTSLVRGVEQAVRPQARQAGLDLAVTGADLGLTVRGDEMQLERVLLNLVSNALKFTPSPGRVEVEVDRARDGDGDWARVRVRDTGIGIPVAEQEQLFSRFFRASNAVDKAVPGTGLGLAIVRSIVEHHGGRLDLVSADGAGTTVTVLLPLATAAGAGGGADPDADAGPPPAPTGEQPPGSRRFDAAGLSLAD